MKRIALVLVAIVAFASAGCLGPKGPDPQIEELKARMAKVEQQSNDTKTSVDQNISTMAENILTFDNMQQEFEQMRGMAQESKYQNERYNKQYQALRSYLDAQFEKMDKRMAALEAKAGIKTDPSLAVAAVPSDPDKVPVGKKSEKDLFAEAVLLFKQKKYGAAQGKFGEFLKTYPQSELAHEAQYHIGESQFLDKKYSEAILAYDELTTKYPKSKFVPAAILNQAVSFEQMGSKFDAKLFYEKVVAEYPKSPEAEIAKKKLSLMKK